MKQLRTIASRILALALGMLLALPVPTALGASSKTLTVTFTATTYQNRAREALKKINALRKQNGVSELIMASQLEDVAIQRAAELFVFFDHDRPDLTEYDTADDDQSDVNAPLAVAECIAAGYTNAEDLLADWSTSAADSLLDPDFTHVGLGCVYMKDSYNEYYWALYLQGQPSSASIRQASSTAKAGKTRRVSVEIASGMYARADNSHKRFELKPNNLNLKTKKTGEVAVYLYDRYGVKIGKCDADGLSFKSSNTSIFTVSSAGVVTRKKAGTGTLTVSATGLSDAKCTVTIGGSSSSSSSSSSSANSTAVTADTIGDRKPELTTKEYSEHTTLSVYVKGASGYVLYRATSKNGNYSKVDEQATTKRWTLKILDEDLSRAYYYKVRAYKNSNGRRIYSEYSTAVRVSP